MKKFKAAVSLFLSVLLTLIMVLPAFAAGSSRANCSCGTAPVIQVRGIGGALYDANGNEVFSTENIVNGILPVVPQLAEFLVTRETATFVNAAETAVKTIFGPVMYDKNGSRTNTFTADCKTAPVEAYLDFTSTDLTDEEILGQALYEELGPNHSFIFQYDWTANPYDIIEELDAYIETVKNISGHSKVSINAESMGGSIVNLYIAQKGKDNIENLVMANSAFNGLEMIGQLFMGNVDIDGPALAKLISQTIRGNAEYESLLAYIPIFEQLALMANDIMAAEHDAIYNRIFTPVFGYIPSFWVFVPTYSFEAAKDQMFGADVNANSSNPFASESRPYAGADLLEIVNRINSDMQGTTQRVDRLVNGYKIWGVQIVAPINNYFNVTNYNRFMAPVSPSSNWNSDGVIEVYNAGGWATAADMGMTLGENYVQAQLTDKGNFISPDRVIDASTCQAPMNTWFIKNLGHISYDLDDGTADFYVWLLTAKDKYNINTNAKYPQFMYYDTGIPKLMTFAEKEEMDKNNNGGTLPVLPGLPGLPDIDLNGLADALEMFLNGIGNVDLSALAGVLQTLGGAVSNLGGLIGGLLGGDDGNGGSTTPTTPTTPSTDNSTETPTETPIDTPTTDNSNTNTNTNNNSNSGSSSVVNTQAQVVAGEPVFSSGSTVWMIVFAVAAVIAGILIIKL